MIRIYIYHKHFSAESSELKVGIILYTDDINIFLLAIRYATFHLYDSKQVNVYLIAPEMVSEKINDFLSQKHQILERFLKDGGTVHECDDLHSLHNLLCKHFYPQISSKQIYNLCFNPRYLYLITKEIHIRKFVQFEQ